MSEALISEPGLSLWEANPLSPDSVHRVGRTVFVTSPETLQAVQPGQLWYVELPSTEPAISPLEYRALMTANVVIYDRALESAVASFLPLGAYAEPAGSRDTVTERCFRFLRDGWSVARLVDPRGERTDIVRQLAERLLQVEAPASLAVSVFANAYGKYEKIAAELDQLGDAIDARGFDQPITLTIVFSGIGVGAAPRFVVASANGLAG